MNGKILEIKLQKRVKLKKKHNEFRTRILHIDFQAFIYVAMVQSLNETSMNTKTYGACILKNLHIISMYSAIIQMSHSETTNFSRHFN